MIVNLPDHVADDHGIRAFTALVHVQDDGQLMVMVPVPGTERDLSDDAPWLVETFGTPEAISFGAELTTKAAGGGSA